VPDMSWNPPSGPPNGAPIRPSDARREIEEAIDATGARDRELRAELVEIVTARSVAVGRIGAAAAEADEARGLAKRALMRAHESARAGQRTDAGKWTAAAQVFAMRLRDGRETVAALEGEIAAADERAHRVETALAENVGRLEAVVAARLPLVGGRKAARLQQAVAEVVAAASAPPGDLVARTMESIRVGADTNAGDTDEHGQVAPVADDDLERELDVESTDEILDELRAELGLTERSQPSSGAPTDEPAASGAAAPSDDRVPAARR
jgi:hypothetical protein